MPFSKQISESKLRSLIGCNSGDKSMEYFTRNWKDPYVSSETFTCDDFFHEIIVPFLLDRKVLPILKPGSDKEMFYNQIRDKIPECFVVEMYLSCKFFITISPKIGETLVEFMERVSNLSSKFNLNDFVFRS